MHKTRSRYARSIELWEQAKEYIVPGSSTISKRADLYPYGAYPIYLNRAEGATVEDVDGNHYIDFQSALGAVLLGYNHPTVNQAIKTQLEQGSLFSLSSPLLIHLGQKICEHIPCAERVRILKNGSDATTGAVRIARAYTGKDLILTGHYHGWHDWFYASTNLNLGIPKSLQQQVIPFPYDDIKHLMQLFDEHKGKIAAVIMEVTHLHPPSKEYLQKVRELTKDAGVILIFDEVVTGFRFGIGGGQTYFGVTPDLACFAKALGNGSPISLIAGKQSIMDATNKVVTTQTYGEDCLAIAAALATIAVMEQEPIVQHVWALGSRFQQNYHILAEKYRILTQCVGYAPRLQIEFSDQKHWSGQFLKSYLLQETAKDGFLIAHMIFMNYAHTENMIDSLLNSVERVFSNLSTLREHEITLDGQIAISLW